MQITLFSSKPFDEALSEVAGLTDILFLYFCDSLIEKGNAGYEAMGLHRYDTPEFRGLNIIGRDIVEVSPPYDPTGITSLAVATIMFEILCLAADARGRSSCFFPRSPGPGAAARLPIPAQQLCSAAVTSFPVTGPCAGISRLPPLLSPA